MTDRLGGASNILLLSPALNPGEAEACSDILAVSDSTSPNTVAVTYTRSASTWATGYERHAGDLPERLAIIDVGATTRSAGQTQSPRQNSYSGPVTEAVESPDDLTGLGIRISEYLQEWGTDEWNGGATKMVLCFDSLTAVLQYADRRRLFRFLHTMTRRISRGGAVGHYHLNPGAHDEQTLSTLSPLFDAVVEVTEESCEWSVKTRNQ